MVHEAASTNCLVPFCDGMRYDALPTKEELWDRYYTSAPARQRHCVGQVERMNRTIKEATVKKYYYQSHDELKKHLHTFLMAYNFAKRLKTLKELTVYEYICKRWTIEPERFTINPIHHTLGLKLIFQMSIVSPESDNFSGISASRFLQYRSCHNWLMHSFKKSSSKNHLASQVYQILTISSLKINEGG